MTYLLTAIGITPGGSSTVHIYTQTIHRTTQLTNWEGCGPCPIFASYTLAFALQLRKKHRKTSVRVAEDHQLKRSSAKTCCYVLLINYILCIWFGVHRALHRNIISIVKPTRCTNVSNLFYFETTLYMFRTVFTSIIRSSRLYIQQQAFVKQILPSAC